MTKNPIKRELPIVTPLRDIRDWLGNGVSFFRFLPTRCFSDGSKNSPKIPPNSPGALAKTANRITINCVVSLFYFFTAPFRRGKMSKKVSFLVVVAVFCAALSAGCLTAGVFDRQNEAESLYGKGVHAFFDGDYQGVVELLAKVEELGSEDPRPFFFLGLAQWRLGQKDEAEATFKKAAKLEWEDRTGRNAAYYGVSDALKRIQGKERLYVESFRRQAKSDWERADQTRQQVRYGQEKDKGRSILAQLAEGSELPPPEPRRFVGAAPFGARSVDPFRDPDGADDPDKLIPVDDITPIAKPVKKETDQPVAQSVEKEDNSDSFGAADDEMDDDAADKPTPAKPKTPKDDTDPFGTSDDDMDDADPFDPPDAREKKTDEPKMVEKKTDDDDPFGMSSDDENDDNDENDKTDEPKKDDEKGEMDDDDDDPFK